MSGSNSGSNTSKMAVPQAKEAMNRFKQEVASEIGVPLKEGYNGDLTSAQEQISLLHHSMDSRHQTSLKEQS